MIRTVVNADPSHEFRAIEDMFEKLFGGSNRPVSTGALSLPVDILERSGSLLVKASVPGVDPNGLEVSIEKNVLTIRGETQNEGHSESDKIYRREVSYGAFSRSIRLPEGLDLKNVSADFTNGMVTITLPRVPEEKPQALRVPVQVTSPSAIIQQAASDENTSA